MIANRLASAASLLFALTIIEAAAPALFPILVAVALVVLLSVQWAAAIFFTLASGRDPTMTYSPTFQKQADGSRCQWSNCGPTAFATAVDRDWFGVRKGSPPAIRNKIGLFCPGTNSTQNDAAVKALYGTVMEPRFDVPWSVMLDALYAGRGVAVVIRYSVMHGTAFDACRTFDGLHWVYVNAIRRSTTGILQVQVYDPLADHRYSWIPQGPQWWPLSLLQKAAQAVQADHYVDASFTRSTVSTKRVLYSGGKLRSKPTVASTSPGALPFGASTP
jgi:hypothetical protein